MGLSTLPDSVRIKCCIFVKRLVEYPAYRRYLINISPLLFCCLKPPSLSFSSNNYNARRGNLLKLEIGKFQRRWYFTNFLPSHTIKIVRKKSKGLGFWYTAQVNQRTIQWSWCGADMSPSLVLWDKIHITEKFAYRMKTGRVSRSENTISETSLWHDL